MVPLPFSENGRPRHSGVYAQTDQFGNTVLRIVDCPAIGEYDVVRCSDLFRPLNATLKSTIVEARKSFRHTTHVVTTSSPYRYFGQQLKEYLDEHNLRSTWTVMPRTQHSEVTKNIESLLHLIDRLDDHRPQNGDLLLVVGGGALTDMCGFLSSTWRRGTEFQVIYIPTTLIGAVDAAISPKTAINIGTRKNHLGSFASLNSVLVDPGFLATLNRKELLDGMAEMIKVAIVGDLDLFSEIEQFGSDVLKNQFQSSAGNDLIWQAAELFLRLRWDSRFSGRARSIRSFGHFFSRSLEGRSQFHLSHGEAVSIEMHISVFLAHQLGFLTDTDRDRIIDAFSALGLVGRADEIIDCDRIWADDFAPKHRLGEAYDFPSTKEVGLGIFLNKFGHGDLRRAILQCKEDSRVRSVAIRTTP